MMKKGMRKKGSLMMVFALVLCLFGGVVLTPVSEAKALTRKETYQKRYRKLAKKCKKKFKYDGPQQTMNAEAAAEYALWDKELNYVYMDIYKRLSTSQKAKLKSSEIKWIAKRDKKAVEDSADWEGGSGHGLIYGLSLIHSTKQRIRWLIKNYA